ncbi:hypothetical protein ASPTUDRAFT_937671 [Aspergillus tubingensis CBS 134.48]|uniref:Uncharacterized protein n=1 Tax=Aspergillus tubingensis (strain CBS 134.48) TaxID=767770 RepID=A0A1L9MUE0_ASPTC|nr:hypothetical protein ASPTUDRAFT_937671 [Aspergillus tubingensis CBS 134.48]
MRVGSAIMAHVHPDSNQIKDNLLPTEIRGTEILLPEYTDVKLIVKVPQVTGPAVEWKISGFTVTEYTKNLLPDKLNIVLYGGRISKLPKEESTVNYAFRSLRLTKAGCSLLEGYSDCSKITVLTAIAIFLYNCGLNVLLLGASNTAVDILMDQLTALHSIHYEKYTESLNAGEKLPLNLAPGAKRYDTVVPDGIINLNKYDIQNAYEVVNNYLSKPKDPRLGPSSPEEDAKWLAKETAFKKYWDTIGELVVQDASIVAYTHNLAGTPIVRRNLGANRKKIVIIADEDGQALEPDVLIPLVSLDRPGDVLGTIRGVTASEVPGYNEFGYQMGRSLFDRLRRSQFPFTLVSEQLRMQPRLSKSPSAFTYYGKMTDDPSVQSISIDTKFLDALLDWIKTRVPDVNFKSGMELIGVNVMDGETVVNDRTRSRSNLANVTIFDVDPEHI